MTKNRSNTHIEQHDRLGEEAGEEVTGRNVQQYVVCRNSEGTTMRTFNITRNVWGTFNITRNILGFGIF